MEKTQKVIEMFYFFYFWKVLSKEKKTEKEISQSFKKRQFVLWEKDMKNHL